MKSGVPAWIWLKMESLEKSPFTLFKNLFQNDFFVNEGGAFQRIRLKNALDEHGPSWSVLTHYLLAIGFFAGLLLRPSVFVKAVLLPFWTFFITRVCDAFAPAPDKVRIPTLNVSVSMILSTYLNLLLYRYNIHHIPLEPCALDIRIQKFASCQWIQFVPEGSVQVR